MGLISTDVEEDGESDGIVAFAADPAGVEAWTGVEFDVELVGFEIGQHKTANDQRGDLNDPSGQMQGVGGAVARCWLLLWLRGLGLCAKGRASQQCRHGQRAEEQCGGGKAGPGNCTMRDGTTNSHAGIIAEVQRMERVESEESLEAEA